ncbi:Uncharacterised protein [uncultured archaeon]|nr:Uncharacterised protein [uncultured archaeon]
MTRTFDLTVSKSDKICRRDDQGFYQPTEYSYSLTEKDVPEELVGQRTAELQLRITRMISHWEALDGKKTAEEALSDVQSMEQYVREREKHGKRHGSEVADAGRVGGEAPA